MFVFFLCGWFYQIGVPVITFFAGRLYQHIREKKVELVDKSRLEVRKDELSILEEEQDTGGITEV